MSYLKSVATALAAAVMLASPASARDLIATGPGGSIVDYARQASNARLLNTQVRFTGQCASACTLFLSVPARQTCITRGSYFVFHSASGSNAAFNAWGTQYLMDQYPTWVRSWINANGGLGHRNLRMNYNYAAQFIPTCGAANTVRAKT